MEKWDKINAVQRMQDYIVLHIDGDITMDDLISVSGYSLWYSIRLFKEFTNKTPFEYIRALKLTESAKHLRDSTENVIDVALNAKQMRYIADTLISLAYTPRNRVDIK